MLGILSFVLASSSAAATPAPRCAIHGDDVSIEKVVVRPAHEQAFEISIDHQAVTAVPSANATELEVAGDVKFIAFAKQKLWYVATGDVAFANGLVTLRRGAHVIGTGFEPGTASVVGAAVLYADDVMEGEDKPAQESLEGVRVPCEKLSLQWTPDPVQASPEGDETTWFVKHAEHVTLRAEPRANATAVRYAQPGCGGNECLVVSRVDTHGAWTKISTGNESVELAGWVPTSQLQRAPGDGGVGRSYGCMGDHHAAQEIFGGPPTHRAKIAQGAVIYARPSAGAWATTTHDVEVNVVDFKPGATWIAVHSLAGIGNVEGHAYVSITSLVAK